MAGRYRIGEFSYEPDRGVLILNDTERKLEPQVNALLRLLAEQAGETVSREIINAHIWSERVVSDDALRAMIRKLREALGDSARSPRYIRTDPMKGYALIAEVAPVAPAPPQSKPLRRQRWFHISVGLLAVGLLTTIVGLLPYLSSEDEQIGQIELLTRMSGSEVSPDYNPAENRLIFSHRDNKDDFLQLYVKDLSTQQIQRLTWEPADYANALWSPDGTELVYSRSHGQVLQHFIARYEPGKGITDEQVLLSDDNARRYLLAWSRGERAVYLKDNANQNSPAGIAKLNLESGKLTTVTAPSVHGRGDFFARESNDGKMLAILREVEQGKLELLILDIPTGSLLNARILSRPADRLVWSDDNLGLILTSFTGEIQTFEREQDRLTTLASMKNGINDAFHRCGTNCLFMRQHNGNFLDLQEQPNPFLNRPLMASQNLDLPGAEDFPIFAHDQQGLFYVGMSAEHVSVMYRGNQGDSNAILDMPLDTKFDSLQLSPDGGYLTGRMNGRVFLLNVQQPQLHYLTGGTDFVGFPIWSEDGNSLQFSKMEKGTPVLYRYSLETSSTEELTRGFTTSVTVDGERTIQIDDANNAWLFRGEKKRHKLAQLPSLSPNRWQIRGDWLYYTAHEGNMAVMHRANLDSAMMENKELTRNRYRLNFDLSPDGERALFVKSLLAESNLVKVSLNRE